MSVLLKDAHAMEWARNMGFDPATFCILVWFLFHWATRPLTDLNIPHYSAVPTYFLLLTLLNIWPLKICSYFKWPLLNILKHYLATENKLDISAVNWCIYNLLVFTYHFLIFNIIYFMRISFVTQSTLEGWGVIFHFNILHQSINQSNFFFTITTFRISFICLKCKTETISSLFCHSNNSKNDIFISVWMLLSSLVDSLQWTHADRVIASFVKDRAKNVL